MGEAMREFAGYETLVLNLDHIIDGYRSKEHDEKYHRLANSEFDLSKRLIGLAKHTYENYDGNPIRCGDVGSRSQVEMLVARITFAVEIVAARDRLQKACTCNEPCTVHSRLESSNHALCDAIAAYLYCGLFCEWSRVELRELAATTGKLPKSHRLHFCGHPRRYGEPASLLVDISVLLSYFEQGSSERKPLPINGMNVAIIQSALDALTDDFAEEYAKWFRVACAVHDFDSGEIGLALFVRFSSRCSEKAEATDFETFWLTLDRDYGGKKITVGSLVHWARQAGWKQPHNWDLASRG